MFFSDNTNSLKEHLVDDLDYILLPDEAYEKLVSWYGLTEGQVIYLLIVLTFLCFMND